MTHIPSAHNEFEHYGHLLSSFASICVHAPGNALGTEGAFALAPALEKLNKLITLDLSSEYFPLAQTTTGGMRNSSYRWCLSECI